MPYLNKIMPHLGSLMYQGGEGYLDTLFQEIVISRGLDILDLVSVEGLEGVNISEARVGI